MEVLKQKNNAPVEVAHQVCILYAVVNGYLSRIATQDVARFEQELFDLLDNTHAEILESIRSTKTLTPENEAALQALLEAAIASFSGVK